MRQAERLYMTKHQTPVGELTLIGSDRGLREIHWPNRNGTNTMLAAHGEDHPLLKETVRQLDEYFAGRRTSFDIPLDLRGTPFQLAAWRALAEIPFGETRSYGQQAAMIGSPRAVRAVGSANGANPVCIVLPCHRVVGADGSLTGFGGGLGTKRWLLDHEARISKRASQMALTIPA
jgi:methylated-DNA-[protein]-cysteine S-methyltransferase